MNNDWLKNLKAGDKVVYRYHDWWKNFEHIMIVEKITPKGFIKVNGFLFNPKNGNIRGDGNSWIEEATEKRVTKIKQNEKIKYVLGKMKEIKSLTYEQAVELNELLDKWREQG